MVMRVLPLLTEPPPPRLSGHDLVPLSPPQAGIPPPFPSECVQRPPLWKASPIVHCLVTLSGPWPVPDFGMGQAEGGSAASRRRRREGQGCVLSRSPPGGRSGGFFAVSSSCRRRLLTHSASQERREVVGLAARRSNDAGKSASSRGPPRRVTDSVQRASSAAAASASAAATRYSTVKFGGLEIVLSSCAPLSA